MATSKNGNLVTAKTAISHVQGMRTILKGLGRLGEQVGVDTAQLEKKLDNLDYIEATLVAMRDSGKSGLDAGVAAGFVSTRFE